ncbi:12261_t:CDS:10 [Dentiscutata erythropus]|uniref:12261_t:CDS:1 n=1 Tax=Dentiscutata erythropus TaxID=1348616 RepID=A0A9N8VWL9_9GLOM|nr:12261_t:CDS:10 [Dentiscutata erythropus]
MATSSKSNEKKPVVQSELNRLSKEKSPYLLQHANNPVDWYPWCEEAFEKARNENKLIFLSAHESFENEAVAKIMNEHFVNVKETQPDVDRMYMLFVQSFSGSGGWPMSVFLTPELYRKTGFATLLKRMSELWKEQPDEMRKAGTNAIEQLREFITSRGESAKSIKLDMKTALKLYNHFDKMFDDEQGGFDGKSEPKFPTPVQLHFLLRYYYYILVDLERAYERLAIMSINEIRNRGASLGIDFKDCENEAQFLNKLKEVVTSRKQVAEKSLEMVNFTLKKIAMGGIHDHVGNGFHRYSTDRYWHVPHFEKMLYDQAQLLMSFVEAYAITKDQYFAEVARDIVTYVERDLRDPEGGFYSAEDADSYPHEGAKHKLGEVLFRSFQGAFCVWEMSEIKEILGDKNSEIFCWHYGVKPDGNVDPNKDIQGELKRKNVLIQRHTLEETAGHFNITSDQLKETLSESMKELAKYRVEKRPKPHRDDKILAAWNGLMITGLARAYDSLRDKKFLDLAEGAAKFLKEKMYILEKKVLLRSFREGPGDVEGFVDDYSYLIEGLLHLYQSSFNESYLSWAIDLQDRQNQLFYDEQSGGYYNVKEGTKDILLRLKDDHDGAEPSANSVSVSNLILLGNIANNLDYSTKAEQTLKYFAGRLNTVPYSMSAMVASLMLHIKGVKQIMVVGREQNPIVQQFIEVIQDRFIPNKTLLVAKPENELLLEKNEMVNAIVQGEFAKETDDNVPSVHICENFTCGMPISNVEELVDKLKY